MFGRSLRRTQWLPVATSQFFIFSDAPLGTWANFECDDLLGLASEVNCLPFAPDLTAEGDALPHMVKHPFTLMHMYYKGQKFSQEMLAGNPSEQAKKYGITISD